MPPQVSLFTNLHTQQTPAMSHPHAYTDPLNSMLPIDGEDDDDICPICDGDCTCNSSSQPKTIPAPVHAVVRQPSSASTPSTSSAPLKIKLTVPPSLINRAVPPAKRASTSSDNPKRRGRPPKPKATPSAAPSPYQNANPKKSKPAPRAKDTTGTASAPRRTKTKVRRGSDDEYCPAGQAPSASVPSRVDSSVDGDDNLDRDADMDIAVSFPTFMSALSSTSTSSSSSESSSSEDEDTFQSDSSILGEEEQFILAEETQRRHDRARVQRELMGDTSGARRRSAHHPHSNNWEIRPRKNSGDEMDVDMDADSEDGDSSEEDDETEDEEDNDEADVEDGAHVGAVTGEETGEDDVEGEEGLVRRCVDDEQGEETVSEGEAQEGARRGVTFEVTEGWDGSVIFTNGFGDGSGLLDFGFDTDIDAAQFFMAAPFSSGSSSDEDDDDDTAPIHHALIKMEFDDADGEETGYERDHGESEAEDEMDSDDGATTDEELVDADGLPTDRLMRLFRPLPLLPVPNTVSAIDPMSTMSPGPRTGHRRSGSDAQSPRPADILAGHMYWDPEYDHDGPTDEDSGPPVHDVASLTLRGSSEEQEKPHAVVKKEKSTGPRMGTFEAGGGDALRRAVISGSAIAGSEGAVAAVPSPFPRRCGRKRGRDEDDVGSGRSVTRSRTRSVSTSVSLEPHSSLALSPTPFVPSDDPTTPSRDTRAPPASLQASPEPEPEPVLLSDVLDPSLLDSDPFDIPSTDPPSIPLPSSSTGVEEGDASDNGRHIQSLSRWDRIPMGTFRRTRESGDGNDMLLDGMLRSSPFSGMLWSAKGAAMPDQSVNTSPTAAAGGKKGKKGKGRNGRRGGSHMDVIISPVILPVRDRDGDRTPTHATEQYNAPAKGNGNKGRGKESRRDKMLKRKSMMGVSPGGSGSKHHRHHQHHPNTKGRALNGVQRAGGYGGAVPPLSL
ncbi:hypothetical protein DENSPDRAFT_540258 [Dentipellis sp. KUC8613]|nr:hypothetical protein DENSPDRAFT_540258 [Dentipellis sp. KUC8613]